MAKTWEAWNMETFPGGVSSAISPDLLPQNQTAWAGNASFRGGKVETRPSWANRLILPGGLFQGGSYFSVQNGMIVVSIEGIQYRLRIGARNYSYEPITLPWLNSPIIKQNYFQQTVETLVIQDGQSQPILYNGSTARRAESDEVPLGRQMAYGNGRLWVAVNNKELVAGDIRQNIAGSELKFTETQYFSGGGAFSFPRGIAGLAFIAVTGTTDYGTLLCFGKDYTVSLRADITSRDQWADYPGFITNVLNSTGAASEKSICEVNQDLYWRDSNGGIRSLKSSVIDESGPGNSPISREVSRLVDYDAQKLLQFCSSVYHENRLLMTSSPYMNISGGVSWHDLVSLDFAPISTMQGKTFPAYNGQWTGVNFAQLISGKFNGVNRCFGISSDADGLNRLWELDTRNRVDLSLNCGSDTEVESPIVAYVEYPQLDFGVKKARKRLERCDVWIDNIVGEISFEAFWRADDTQKWTQWDEGAACAQVTDPSAATPHVWKNLLPQQRPQIKSFTIPDGIDEITKYALAVGFQHQIRLAWTGRCRIAKVMVYATVLADTDYAERETTECIENDVTGNRINYAVPIFPGCGQIDLTYRSAFGDINLCGYSEYTDISNPPRLYLVETYDGVMTMRKTTEEDCTIPDCPGSLVFAGVAPDGIAEPTAYVGNFGPTGVTVGSAKQFTASGCFGHKTTGDMAARNIRIKVNSFTAVNGQFINLLPNTTYSVEIQSEYLVLSWYTLEVKCMTVDAVGDIWVDNWTYDRHQTQPNCVETINDNKSRTLNGVPATFPAGLPAAVYSGLATTLVARTQITVTGNGICIPDPNDGGKYLRADGVVHMTLSSENTQLDLYEDMTPNGAFQTSKAGTVVGDHGRQNAQISIATLTLTEFIRNTQYQVTVNFAADIGTAPASLIETFMTSGGGTAVVTIPIPFGIAGSTVRILNYQIVEV
jgi:hypothetical protein